jgi:L-asparagine transporter-like permease
MSAAPGLQKGLNQRQLNMVAIGEGIAVEERP